MALSLASAGIRRASLGTRDLNVSLGALLLVPKAQRPDIQRFYVDPPSAVSGVEVSSPITWHWNVTGANRYRLLSAAGAELYAGTATSYTETLSTSPADLDDDVYRTLVALSPTDLESRSTQRFRRLDPPTVSATVRLVRDVPNSPLRAREAFVDVTIYGDPFPSTITLSPLTGTHSGALARLFRGSTDDSTVTRQLHLVRANPPVETVTYTIEVDNGVAQPQATFDVPW